MSDLKISLVRLTFLQRPRPLEFSFIVEPTPVGPTIGCYSGQEFTEFVRDAFGRLFVFSGIASRRTDGRLIANDLQPGEFFAVPGLIYCLTEYAK